MSVAKKTVKQLPILNTAFFSEILSMLPIEFWYYLEMNVASDWFRFSDRLEASTSLAIPSIKSLSPYVSTSSQARVDNTKLSSRKQ